MTRNGLLRRSALPRLKALVVPVVVALAACASAFSQTSVFRYYGHAEGLYNLAVQCLLQDHTGFLWVGTQNGLYRYDGSRFTGYGRSEGLPSSRVESLHETSDGRLWVGTRAGLAVRVGDHFQHVAQQEIREILGQSGMDSDSAGRLYVATAQGLLIGSPDPSHPGQMFFQVHKSPGPDDEQKALGLEVVGPGKAWYGCGRTLCLFENGRVVRLQDPGIPPDRWDSLHVDLKGNVWARSSRHLIVMENGSHHFVPRYPDLPPKANFAHLDVSSDGTVMLPTDRGLARLNDKGFTLTGKKEGLITDSVQCVLEDREGSIWLGLGGVGLARWLGYGRWEAWTEAQGLNSDTVWAIHRDPRGALWVGTSLGLNRYSGGKLPWQVWNRKQGLRGDRVRTVVSDDDGVWAGLAPGGVARVDARTGRVESYGRESGLEDEEVTTLAVEPGHRVWAGTQSGLFLGAPHGARMHFERVALPGGDANEIIFQCIRDRSGRLWAAGSRGLACFDGQRWTRYTTNDGLRTNYVAYVAEGADGSFWIGYREAQGISRLTFRDGRVDAQHYTTDNGLQSRQAIFVGVDHRGWVWYGSDNGADVYDGRQWKHYGSPEGLIWDDCDGNAFFADNDGSVWIGTSHGLSHFRPAPLESGPAPQPPPVVLTSARLGSQPRDPSREWTVPFSQRSFEASFAAMTFVHETSVRFRYRLQGLEDDWTETDRRLASYPALPSGYYTFEVQASALGVHWSPAPARFSFMIEAPWWRQWPFLVLEFLALVAAIGGSWQWRLRRLRQVQRRLEALVEERTRDVVEQKAEIEKLLVEARQATVLKSEFLANMSHEIRTPMNGILGFTSLALETQLTADQRDYLETVKDSADSLLTILNDILDFSKIEAGRLDLDSTPFSLRECLGATLKIMRGEAEAKGLGISCEVEPNTPDLVVGDPVRLRQIVLNLIGNAIKFTPAGSVSLRATLDSRSEQSLVIHFSVQDTGIGIPLEQQSVIFEPFRQADGSRTRRYGGTGLGLAICSRLVGLMEGHIWLESKVDRGSTFHFTALFGVPAAPAATEIGQGEAHAVEARSLSILLAEDNEMNQELVVRMLERGGHKVTVAPNGREALLALERAPFDLILMDVQMPEMDGLEATAQIRSREMQIPILALTAHAMKGDREKCLAAGMNGYIAKPVRQDELFDAIRMILESRDTPSKIYIC